MESPIVGNRGCLIIKEGSRKTDGSARGSGWSVVVLLTGAEVIDE